jgi:hypothetical protein
MACGLPVVSGTINYSGALARLVPTLSDKQMPDLNDIDTQLLQIVSDGEPGTIAAVISIMRRIDNLPRGDDGLKWLSGSISLDGYTFVAKKTVALEQVLAGRSCWRREP